MPPQTQISFHVPLKHVSLLAQVGGIGSPSLVLLWGGFVTSVLLAIDSSANQIPWENDYAPRQSIKWFYFGLLLWPIALPFYLVRRHHVLKSRRNPNPHETRKDQ